MNLDYLKEKPKVIRWEVVAGPELGFIQTYDVVYDEYDYRIRQIGI